MVTHCSALNCMKKILGLIFVTTSTFALAAPVLDKDGVPVVDIHGTIVKSTDATAIAAAKQLGLSAPGTRMIAVDEKRMQLQEFLLTYCQGKAQNETCVRGKKIERIDSFSGPKEQLPKGL